jgi:ribosomal protein S18 acetylase RimI-like enzyme
VPWTARPVDHRAPDVAAELMAVQRAAYRVEADLIGYQGLPGLAEGPAEIAGLDLTVLAVRDDGGELLGLLGYGRDDGVVDIDRLAVAPAAFRRGVGRALVGAVHDREADARRFKVSTGSDNTPAVALYTSMGYLPVGSKVIEGCPVTRFARDTEPEPRPRSQPDP